NPTYHYDPSLHFRGVHVKEPLDLPPGPNNPVGAVWINLSAEGYGIHGTPDPDKISKAASHGCVRLTNWDALELARHVSKGTPVTITRSAKIGQGEKTSAPQGKLRSMAVHQGELPSLPEANPARGQRNSVAASQGAMPPLPEQNPARAHRQAH